MLRNITLSAEEEWIALAREKAVSEKSTLNNLFRLWIKQYIDRGKTETEIDQVMESIDYVYSGKKFTRDELNER
jgi:hypothetical protein